MDLKNFLNINKGEIEINELISSLQKTSDNYLYLYGDKIIFMDRLPDVRDVEYMGRKSVVNMDGDILIFEMNGEEFWIFIDKVEEMMSIFGDNNEYVEIKNLGKQNIFLDWGDIYYSYDFDELDLISEVVD